MKKIMLLLVAPMFILGFFSFSLTSVNAQSLGVTTTGTSLITKNLDIGSRGSNVKILQQFLKDEGYYTGRIDGVYGKKTARYVKDFQDDNGLEINGRVDAQTRAVINSMLGGEETGSNYDEFTACLTQKGATLYGAYWSPFGAKIKELFGQSFKNINYVECSTTGGYNETQICKDKNINGYPTWIFADGSRLVGFAEADLHLNSLIEKTSCSLGGVSESLKVTSPNGGERFVNGGYMLIKWKTASVPTYSNIYLELRPAENTFAETTRIDVISSSNRDYNWFIPGNIIPGKYIIEIYSADQNGNVTDITKDISDSYFTITNSEASAADAIIKANLANMRAQAELIYDMDGDYDAVCGANGVSQNYQMASMINAVNKASGGNAVCGKPAYGAAPAWAVSSPLKSTGYWCVDSTGVSKATSYSITSNNVSCSGNVIPIPSSYLSAYLDAASPLDQNIPSGSSNITAGIFKISTTSEAFTLTSATFGLDSYPWCPGVPYRLYDGATLIGEANGSYLNCDFVFYLNFYIPANTSKMLTLKFNLGDSNIPTNPIRFKLTKISATNSQGLNSNENIMGLPVTTNKITISSSTRNVPVIKSILPAGCTGIYGYSPTGNISCGESRSSARVGETVYISGSNFQDGHLISATSYLNYGVSSIRFDFISPSLVKFVVPTAMEATGYGVKIDALDSYSNEVTLYVLSNENPRISNIVQKDCSHLGPCSAEEMKKPMYVITGSNFNVDQQVEFTGKSDDGSQNYDTSFSWAHIPFDGKEMSFNMPNDMPAIKSGTYTVRVYEIGRTPSNPFSLRIGSNIEILKPGSLDIDPNYIALASGETKRIKANFTSPCTASGGLSCVGTTIEVSPTWSISNESIASLRITTPRCAVGYTCPKATADVYAVSPGYSELTATYTDSNGKVYTKTIKIDVTSSIPKSSSIVGYADSISCSIIGGWALNKNSLSSSVLVNIYDEVDGYRSMLSRAETTGLRPDVNSAYSATGNHGFTITTPSSVKDGRTHKISVYAVGENSSEVALIGSPQNVNCSLGSNIKNSNLMASVGSVFSNDNSAENNNNKNITIPTSFRFTQFLEQGSYGQEVRELQRLLNSKGYDVGKVDGVFGSKVKEMLIKFQGDNGLKADGILGYEMRSFLNK